MDTNSFKYAKWPILYILLPPVGVYLSDRHWSDTRFTLVKVTLYVAIIYLYISLLRGLPDDIGREMPLWIFLMLNVAPAFTQMDKDTRDGKESIQMMLAVYIGELCASLVGVIIISMLETVIAGSPSLVTWGILILILSYKGIGIYENWPFIRRRKLSDYTGINKIVGWGFVVLLSLLLIGGFVTLLSM